MANYTIDRSLAAAGSITVTEATIDTSTNVTLVGQNYTGYGDEIATNFLQMLENFAADTAPNSNPRVPGSTALPGQLWYDTTSSNPVLRVYDGTSWQAQAKANTGTTTDSVLRWNNATGVKRYEPEERVRVTDAGSLILANDATSTNAVTFNHGGTNLTATFTGTTDFTISGLSGDLTVVGGRGLSVENGATALAIRAGGSSDINFTAASATTLNMPASVKMVTAAATNARAGLQIPEMIGTPSAPADGDIWVTAAGEFFARLNGVTVDLAAAAGGTVTSTGSPADNQIAVWTAVADQLEGTAGLTYNGSVLSVTGDVSGTTIGGITQANLLDKAATETVSGAYTFSNASPITATAGDISAQGGNGFVATDGAYAIAIRTDSAGGTIDFTHSNTPYWDVTGISRAQFAAPIYGTSISSAATFRSIGDASTWNTSDSFISFYDSDQSEHGMQIGTTSGSTAGFVNSRIGQLDLYASNSRIMQGLSFAQTFYASGQITATIQNPFTANHSSSILVYDRNLESHPTGFNGSPLADNVLDDINTGNRTVSLSFIGKMVSRTTSTSRIFTLANIATIPVGATILLHNGSSGGTFTIDDGPCTLEWVDGSGSSPVTGNRLLANNSVATLRKKSNAATNVWQIWGNGLS